MSMFMVGVNAFMSYVSNGAVPVLPPMPPLRPAAVSTANLKDDDSAVSGDSGGDIGLNFPRK